MIDNLSDCPNFKGQNIKFFLKLTEPVGVLNMDSMFLCKFIQTLLHLQANFTGYAPENAMVVPFFKSVFRNTI